MSHLSFLTRAEIEKLGPPTPEDLEETGVSDALLRNLALKQVSIQTDATSALVAEKLHLPSTLSEEILYGLYREKLIEMRLKSAVGTTRYAMLDAGWERLVSMESHNGYRGPEPVSLADYSYMMRLQARPSLPASIDTIRSAFSDLVLHHSLLQTRRTTREHARCWVEIERPLIMVGGELTLYNTNLTWYETSRYYDAPFQIKANGGTLVIDDFGRQPVSPRDLLNRWIQPLERRIDCLTLRNGKKIEMPFEQLVIFSTNLDEAGMIDEAFLRRMGYRVRVEMPTPSAYTEIFKRAATAQGITIDEASLEYLLGKYAGEGRPMKSSEPRDLLSRVSDLCLFEGRPQSLTPELLDLAWRNYFGSSHTFENLAPEVQSQSVSV